MSPTEIVKAFVAAYEAGNIDEAGSYLADNFVFSGPVPQPQNKAAFLTFMQDVVTGFPDWKFNLSDLHEHGSVVHATIQITGAHTGELRLPIPGAPPIAPTGKKIKLAVQHPEYTIKGDKIVSVTAAPDPDAGLPGILKQLGVKMP